MKSIATLVLLMTLGVFAIGCEAKKEKAPAGGEGAAPPAGEPAPAGGEEKK
jgi:hypothetical protein